jgi:hypothetical protein
MIDGDNEDGMVFVVCFGLRFGIIFNLGIKNVSMTAMTHSMTKKPTGLESLIAPNFSLALRM